MNRQYTSDPQQRHAVADEFGGGVSWVFALLFLFLLPNIVIAQAPAPEEALEAVVECLRDDPAVIGDWRLGFDSVRAERHLPDVRVDAASHREVLTRIAERRGIPFYGGEDFGRVICDASSDPERPAVNCEFSHGTRAMLMLTVAFSDEDHGITRVHAVSGAISASAHLRDGDLWTGFGSRTAVFDMVYDSEGNLQFSDSGIAQIFRQGSAPVDEIRGTRPGT